MRGRPIGERMHKYCYRPAYKPRDQVYITYHFSRRCGSRAEGEVVRGQRNEKKWKATHYSYVGLEDWATGSTRDEAVDKLLALLGEG